MGILLNMIFGSVFIFVSFVILIRYYMKRRVCIYKITAIVKRGSGRLFPVFEYSFLGRKIRKRSFIFSGMRKVKTGDKVVLYLNPKYEYDFYCILEDYNILGSIIGVSGLIILSLSCMMFIYFGV